MNATQRGRRADALFYDKVSRLDLCNKVALLESEVEDLRDEIYGLHCTIASLEAENATLGPTVTGETSDGYHTFNELYRHRAVLFSVIVRDHPDLAWKSKLHSDGTMYDGMFIVGIETPQGQATYHYDIDPYWEMFDCGELERAPEWDGHTPDEAIDRIATLGAGTCQLKPWEMDRDTGAYDCMQCACGYVADVADWAEWCYCPSCSRKVVDG